MNQTPINLFSAKTAAIIAVAASSLMLTACGHHEAQQPRARNTTGREQPPEPRTGNDQRLSEREVDHSEPQTRSDSEQARADRASEQASSEQARMDQASDQTRSDRAGEQAPSDQNNGILPTAQDQPNEQTDLEITRLIREQITANSSLSVRTRSATVIVTQNAVVTLRGNVRSNAERDSIEGTARSTSGVSRVDSHLVVRR